MKRILFSCFENAISVTIADMVRRNGNGIQIAAILSVDKTHSCDLGTNVKWLCFDDKAIEFQKAFANIDAVVGLLYDDRLTDIVQLAKLYHSPLIYSGGNITANQLETLREASSEIPVLFYKYQQAKLPEIMANIAQYAQQLDDMKATGLTIICDSAQ